MYKRSYKSKIVRPFAYLESYGSLVESRYAKKNYYLVIGCNSGHSL